MSIDVIKKVSDSLKSNVSAHVWSNQIVGTESILFAENSFASGIENIYSDRFDDDSGLIYKDDDYTYINGHTIFNDTVFDDLRVSANAVKTVGSSNIPDFAKFTDNGGGSVGVYTYLFDPTTLEQVFFNVQIPHCQKLYSALSPHVHYSPTSDAAGYVKWGLEYTFANIDGIFGNSNIIYGSGLALGSKKHSLCELPDILNGSISGVSSMLCCRLFRDAANDDYGGDVAFLEFDFHYEIDSLGSNREYYK